MSETEITHSSEFYLEARCESTVTSVQGKTLPVTYNRNVATGTRPCHQNIVEYSSCKYEMPINRNVVFSRSCGAGMRYGKKPSEFGVPRGSTAWRTRGPPMAVTESETQFPAILSQLHSCSALRGHFFRTLHAAGHCRVIASPSFIG